VENYGIDRSRIGPDTRMTDLLPLNVIEDGWPFLQMFIDARTPPFRVAIELFGLRLSEQTLTMRQLVGCLIQVNGRFLPPPRDSADQIWQRLVAVIVRQQKVRIEEVKPEARFGRDLGID
jgi:hypothetical protein